MHSSPRSTQTTPAPILCRYRYSDPTEPDVFDTRILVWRIPDESGKNLIHYSMAPVVPSGLLVAHRSEASDSAEYGAPQMHTIRPLNRLNTDAMRAEAEKIFRIGQNPVDLIRRIGGYASDTYLKNRGRIMGTAATLVFLAAIDLLEERDRLRDKLRALVGNHPVHLAAFDTIVEYGHYH